MTVIRSLLIFSNAVMASTLRRQVSEFLNGKRDLNKDHIEKLSKFHVSPAVFF